MMKNLRKSMQGMGTSRSDYKYRMHLEIANEAETCSMNILEESKRKFELPNDS